MNERQVALLVQAAIAAAATAIALAVTRVRASTKKSVLRRDSAAGTSDCTELCAARGVDEVANLGGRTGSARSVDEVAETGDRTDSAVASLVSLVRQQSEAAASSQHRASAPADGEWHADEWVESAIAPHEIIARALLRPLADDSMHGSTEYAFLRALGGQTKNSTRAAVRMLLAADSFVDELCDGVCAALAQLSDTTASSGQSLNEKFIMTGTRGIRFAAFSKAEAGIAGLVGDPHADLRASMHREHCRAADSRQAFKAFNYRTSTTSEIEWFVVSDPTGAPASFTMLVESPIERWRSAVRRVCDRLRHKGNSIASVAIQVRGWPQEATAAGLAARRSVLPAEDFEAIRREKSNELQAAGIAPLGLEEFLGGRLYTGPMYTKYNTILRGLDDRKSGPLAALFHSLTFGNCYTTTLHVINSAVVKLSQLTAVGTVYRGVAGSLPAAFLERNEYGALGGVELAFLSTSLHRQTAVDYAGDETPVVIEMQMGMTGRGADLSWLSQYPLEGEVWRRDSNSRGRHPRILHPNASPWTCLARSLIA